jgi:SAM-dependent methyltransferase
MSSTRIPFPSSSFELLAGAEADHWWFRARNKILMWTVATKVESFKNYLEIGCGTGFVLENIHRLYPDVKLHGAEYFEEGLAFARQRIPSATFKQLDATVMDENAIYDVIGAFDVVEHIEKDEVVLRNLATALKPGGSLILTVPQHRWLWSEADEFACHVRRYSRSELTEKVKRAGLDVNYVTSFVTLLVPLMWLARLRAGKGNYDPMSEFKISPWLNRSLEMVMQVEFFLLKIGCRFPLGGSLLLVAKKN